MEDHELRTPDIGTAVTHWLVERLMLRGSEHVLEIAGGSGVVSFATAATGRPAIVICSDVDVDVVATARRRADSKPRGNLWNIVFLAADMLRLPFRDAAFDAAVCRWGFMFARDPVVPFREVRRVLRNGGRLVFAIWSTPEQNPWQSILDDALTAFGIEDRTAQRRFGGMFGLADEGPLRTMLQDVGFLVHEVHPVPLVRHYQHLDEYWRLEVDVGGKRAARLRALSAADAEAFRRHLVDGLSRYVGSSGYDIPGLALGVAAVAERAARQVAAEC